MRISSYQVSYGQVWFLDCMNESSGKCYSIIVTQVSALASTTHFWLKLF